MTRFIKNLVKLDIVETTDICTETTNFTPVLKVPELLKLDVLGTISIMKGGSK